MSERLREAFANASIACDVDEVELVEEADDELAYARETALLHAKALDEERRAHARTRRRLTVLETHNARLAGQVEELQRQVVDLISLGNRRK